MNDVCKSINYIILRNLLFLLHILFFAAFFFLTFSKLFLETIVDKYLNADSMLYPKWKKKTRVPVAKILCVIISLHNQEHIVLLLSVATSVSSADNIDA